MAGHRGRPVVVLHEHDVVVVVLADGLAGGEPAGGEPVGVRHQCRVSAHDPLLPGRGADGQNAEGHVNAEQHHVVDETRRVRAAAHRRAVRRARRRIASDDDVNKRPSYAII